MHWDGFIVSDKTWMHTPEALAKHYISYNAKVGDTISPKRLSGVKGEWKSDFESPPFWKECPTLKRIMALRSIRFLLGRSLFSVYMKKRRKLLVYLIKLCFGSGGNWRDPTRSSRSRHVGLRLSSEAPSHSEVTFLSEFVGRVTLRSPLPKLAEQLRQSFFKGVHRPTCLEEWGLWLFPQVEKWCRFSLMSWLSVWICSDLRTLVRANGGGGKEARSRECSLYPV